MEEWILYSILVLLITSFLVLIMKYLGTQINLNEDEIESIICCSFIISGLLAFLYLLIKKRENILSIINNPNHNILLIIIILFGLLLLLNFIFQGKAHNKCKIGGLPLIIINMNIITVLLISTFLYNTNINYKTILGIFLAISGLSLVILNN